MLYVYSVFVLYIIDICIYVYTSIYIHNIYTYIHVYTIYNTYILCIHRQIDISICKSYI